MFKVELTDDLIRKHLEKDCTERIIGIRITHKTLVQISALALYGQILQLNLSHCHVGSLSLEIPNYCPSLVRLELQNNQISDCTFLLRLPALEYLNLAENQIASLSDFVKLERLHDLDIRCNRISTFQEIALIRDLPIYKLMVQYNSKKDNGIVSDVNYRARMLYLLPHVKILDFQNVDLLDRVRCINLYRQGQVSENVDLQIRISAVKRLVAAKQREIQAIRAEIERTDKIIYAHQADELFG